MAASLRKCRINETHHIFWGCLLRNNYVFCSFSHYDPPKTFHSINEIKINRVLRHFSEITNKSKCVLHFSYILSLELSLWFNFIQSDSTPSGSSPRGDLNLFRGLKSNLEYWCVRLKFFLIQPWHFTNKFTKSA